VILPTEARRAGSSCLTPCITITHTPVPRVPAKPRHGFQCSITLEMHSSLTCKTWTECRAGPSTSHTNWWAHLAGHSCQSALSWTGQLLPDQTWGSTPVPHPITFLSLLASDKTPFCCEDTRSYSNMGLLYPSADWDLVSQGNQGLQLQRAAPLSAGHSNPSPAMPISSMHCLDQRLASLPPPKRRLLSFPQPTDPGPRGETGVVPGLSPSLTSLPL
jgi:hypothetical protein